MPTRREAGSNGTTFHRIHPDEHDRIVSTVIDFDPHVLVHVGVWEPNARAAPKLAAELTDRATTSILGAAAECRSLEHVVVRSAITIYGKDSLTAAGRGFADPADVGMGSHRCRHRANRNRASPTESVSPPAPSASLR